MNYTLITGASSGIGSAFAYIFASKNHNLILVARNEDKLLELKNKIQDQYGVSILTIAKDITLENSVNEIYETIKNKNISVNVLINNAGFGDFSRFLDSDWAKQKNMVDLNITALMEMSYVFGNEMKKIGGGNILNVASVASLSAGPYMATYYASKAFVLSFSQAIAEELKDSNINVSALCPGPTSTGFEAAADMKYSKMFIYLPVAKAEDVAQVGYDALMANKVIKYYGIVNKLMNIGSRLLPRSITRKFAKLINGIPK